MTTLNFKDVYENQFHNISNYIKSLDTKAGFFRSEEDHEEMIHEFFAEIFETKKRNNRSYRLVDTYDPNRSESNNPQFKFLIGLIKNFYASQRTKDLKRRETLKNIKQEQLDAITCFHNKSDEENYYQDEVIINNQEKDLGFCHDIKKLSRDFVKKLKGLELKAYKYLIEDQMSPKQLAKVLGVSSRTAYNLKESINKKAQFTMEAYIDY